MTTAVEQTPPVRLARTLVLVGLMGAGKTSVGRRLAEALQVPFHDSDHEIELAAGMTIKDIFSELGEPAFREGEVRVISRLLYGTPGVLATGGGAFMSEDVRRLISERGVSVWLNGDLSTLWDRVKDRNTRPLLQQPDPKGVLASLIEARYPTYGLADIAVRTEGGLAHEVMVERILAAVRSYEVAQPERGPILVTGE